MLEQDLEDMLRAQFPFDSIEPVPKGMRGADVLQLVHNSSGQVCGTIIWESKSRKAWSYDWIQKLKEDQREVRAEIAVIMTTTLPKEVKNFGIIDGMWVTDCTCVLGLATALRSSLIQISITKTAAEGKNEKMELLYNYLSGADFRLRVEGIVETFIAMKEDLDREKRAITKLWAQRDKQIEKVIKNTSRMYGDMQGIIGSSLPQIESLELKALPDGRDDTDLTKNNGDSSIASE